jgi:hypothetical protein
MILTDADPKKTTDTVCDGSITVVNRRREPKRLRLRLLAVAGRVARGSRRLRLRLAQTWPWAADITAAIGRLQAIPSG